MSGPSSTEVLEFHFRPTNPQVSPDDVRKLVNEAVAEAVRESSDVDSARAEMAGAVGGLGETLVILLIAAAKGVAAAGGKYFFDAYVKPKLQKKNLQVSEAAEKKDPK